jgi:hypothetical protein
VASVASPRHLDGHVAEAALADVRRVPGLIVRGGRATSVAIDERVPEAAIAEVIVHLLGHLARDANRVPFATCPGRTCPRGGAFAFWG